MKIWSAMSRGNFCHFFLDAITPFPYIYLTLDRDLFHTNKVHADLWHTP